MPTAKELTTATSFHSNRANYSRMIKEERECLQMIQEQADNWAETARCQESLEEDKEGYWERFDQQFERSSYDDYEPSYEITEPQDGCDF